MLEGPALDTLLFHLYNIQSGLYLGKISFCNNNCPQSLPICAVLCCKIVFFSLQ